MAELLLQNGHEVAGLVRRTSFCGIQRIEAVKDKIKIYRGDMCDETSVSNAVRDFKPDRVFNLAAQSDVRESFYIPAYTFDVNAKGAMGLFSAVSTFAPNARVYQAGSSEMFGNSPSPQDEATAFMPLSPYAVAKVAAHYEALNWRRRGMFISNGILFNHESPRRGGMFVTKKIIQAAKAIKAGTQSKIRLGAIESSRDWGYAPEYVEGILSIIEHSRADDYVLATGECWTVRKFAESVFGMFGLKFDDHYQFDESMVRPNEVTRLQGNPFKAWRDLGWDTKVKGDELVKVMVEAER